jgi:hypothetical protein
VAHPGHELAFDAVEQRAAVVGEDRLAVLPDLGGRDLAAERAREQVHAVADGQDRQAALQEALGEARGAPGS